MAWLMLVVAGLLEVGWAIGLKYTQGFTKPVPTVLTVTAMVVSLGMLGLAVRHLPVGTAYAVWTGIGTVGTAILGIMLFKEPATAMRITCITLIVAGVIVTTIARYGTASLPAATEADVKRRRTVRVLLILIGIFLACVGIFHVDTHFAIHNTVACGMAVAFAVLVFALARLVPPMPKAFVILGFVYVAVVVVLGVFFAVGYYNLTAVELVAAILIFSWIIVFLRNVGAIAQRETARPEVRADQEPVAA